MLVLIGLGETCVTSNGTNYFNQKICAMMAERKFYAKGPLMLYASLCLVVLMNALDVCMLIAQQLYYDYFNVQRTGKCSKAMC